MSSVGVGILSAPVRMADAESVPLALDDATVSLADSHGQALAQGQAVSKPRFDEASGEDGMSVNSNDGWYYGPDAGPLGNWSYRDSHNVPAVAQMGYEGNGVTVGLVDTGIDFVSENLEGKYMVVDDPASPYYGWPVAFDALGLPEYLLSKEVRGGGLANTTLNGTGPFDIDHEIKVDGKRDFLRNEKVGEDRFDDIKTPGTATGNEFDITELWVTRDTDFWYGGTRTRNAQIDRTFGFSLDFDGPASGGLLDPHGNYIDFEASHSAPVSQLSYDSVNNRVASCAGFGTTPAITNGYEKNSVKIWGQDGTLLRSLPTEQHQVTSVIWSPNGHYLAYQTSKDIVIYNADTWTELRRYEHSPSAPYGPNYWEAMAFSANSTVLMAGSLLASNNMFVMNVVTGSVSLKPITTPHSIVYSPTGDRIALGLSGGQVLIIDPTTFGTLMSFKAPGLVDIDPTDIETLAWNPAGTHIATGRAGVGSIDVWNLTASDNRMQWGGSENYIGGVEFSNRPGVDKLYLRGIEDEASVNGLTAYKLGGTETGIGGSGTIQLSPTMATGGNHSWGIRVWKRSAAGAETEITAGVQAVVNRSADGFGTQVGNWNCPATPLNPTDSLVVRFYQGRDVATPGTLAATFTTPPLNSTQLNGTTWTIQYFTRRNSNLGSLQERLDAHGTGSSVSALFWTAGSLTSAGSDGKVVIRNPSTFAVTSTRESRYGSPITSMAVSGTDTYVATADCTVRKYPAAWSSYTPFVNHRPDVMIYIPYLREKYSFETGSQKLDTPDEIQDPLVYKWNGATWDQTNMTNIFGKAFYKGNLAGEWTEWGFVEWALPRNFTAWPNHNEVFVNAFTTSFSNATLANASRPQDTVPSDCNVPSVAGKVVDWAGTQVTTLSSWGRSFIPKITVNHTAIGSRGTCHFGYHPSGSLNNLFGGLVPMVVIESTSADVWDEVWVDMNLDFVIDGNDPAVNKANPVLGADIWDRTKTSVVPGQFTDGVFDISGGLLYFIGDGVTKLPYSDRMSEVLIESGDQLEPFNADNPMPIPRNGEVVAFYGDMDFDIYEEKVMTHGTQMASAIAGDGFNAGEFGPVRGMSPNVTFLPICNAHYAPDYAMYFAVEGYDGTPNTGDEANIVAMGQYFTGYGSGFDEYTNIVEYLVNRTGSSVVFVSPAGNDGSGYGTVASPCGMSSLVVGFAEDNIFVSGGGEVHHQGMVSELSSRGPTAAGLAKPDVIALGLGDVDMPLQASGSLTTSVGGKSQSVLWKSSDLACAVATGSMALIFEAYEDKHNAFPNTYVAMDIVRSSARDLGYDTLTQGAGFIDVLAAVKFVKGESGLVLNAPSTSFGNTFGLDYQSFVNVVGPGEEASLTVTATNPRTVAQTAAYSYEYLSRASLQERYQTVDKLNGKKVDVSDMVPPSAEVVKVTAQTNFTWLVPWANGTGSDTRTFLNPLNSYSLTLWDWVDSQAFGTSGYGQITADELSYLTSVDYGYVNSMTCTLSNPHGSLEGKLVVEIFPLKGPDPARTPVNPDSLRWKISVESFTSAPMAWITMDKAGENIVPGGHDNVTLTADVPADAQTGSYTGSFVSAYAPTAATHTLDLQPSIRNEGTYLYASLYSTSWDDGAQGNHWSDWTAPDADMNGIVDSPYNFNTAGKRDRFPLVQPVDVDPMTAASPIEITDNADFAAHASWGDGTAADPWVIRNLAIDGSAFMHPGISVSGTTDHFMIVNCAINNSQGPGIELVGVENATVAGCDISLGAQHGIFMDSCTRVLIEKNVIHDNGAYGLKAIDCPQVLISENDAFANDNGLGVEFCDEATISGNEVSMNAAIGIEIKDSSYCEVRGNHIHDEAGYGVWLEGASMTVDGNTFTRNLFQNFTPDWLNTIGLTFYAYDHSNTVVTQNDFVDCDGGVDDIHILDDGALGLWDGNYWSNDPNKDGTPFPAVDGDGDGISDMDDNSPLAAQASAHMTYHAPAGPIVIASDADFATSPGVINHGAAGTAADPYIISGWDIDTSGNQFGISITGTAMHFVVMNNIIHGNVSGTGIALDGSPNGSVRCNLLHTLGNGISVDGANDCLIIMNDVHASMNGISATGSTGVAAVANEAAGGARGILLDSCADSALMLNRVSSPATAGISVADSIDIDIGHNTLSGAAAGDGLLLQTSENCTASHNTIDSFGYGIRIIDAAGFNDLHHNNLLGNTIQAYDNFAGDTVPDFQLPGNFTATYDVWSTNVTYDGVVLAPGVAYTVDYDTGLITFTPTLQGKSGGAYLEIKAAFMYEQSIPTMIKLPDTRLTAATVTVKATIHKIDGTVQHFTPITSFEAYRKVGLVVLNSTFALERGVTFTVNYTYYAGVGIVPITLNVASGYKADFTFGDKDCADAPNVMPTFGVRAGQGNSLESGDRRYYYVWIPNQGMFGVTQLKNFYLYNEIEWALGQSDVNIVVYGKGDVARYTPAAPYLMQKLGATEEKADFSSSTTTGGPRDILVTPFNHEILTICVSSKALEGSGEPVTTFEGKSGWLRLSDNNPKVWTNEAVGHTSVSFTSGLELPGVYASIVGPAQGEKTLEEIYQDDLSLYDLSTLEGWLTMNAVAGFTKVFTVKNALSWDVHIYGHPECPDLDLAVFLDGLKGQPKDGVAQWQEIITQSDVKFEAYGQSYGTGRNAYSADADADEALKFINPPDGDYIVKVLGFTVTKAPGYFDLEVKTILAGVEGYKLTHHQGDFADIDTTNSAYMNTEPVTAYTERGFDVNWAFPEGTADDVYGGIFVLGVPESQKLIVISVDVIFDRMAPGVTPTFPSPNSIISETRPTITAKLEDPSRGELDPNGVRVLLDGMDITHTIPLSFSKTTNSAGIKGYWFGDVVFKPYFPLSEGGHVVIIEAADTTGNVERAVWGFTVDTTEPMLSLNGDGDTIFTNTPELRLNGVAETGTAVTISGTNGIVRQRSDNTFSIDLELEDGANYLTVRGTDLAGNTYETTRTVNLDSVSPAFRRVVALDGSTTNKRITGVYGEMSEPGTLTLNGNAVPVNSDGTFRYESVQLIEGRNTQVMAFTDQAGNTAYNYLNITLDTAAPALAVGDVAGVVRSEWLNITGTTDEDAASLTVNGKLVDVGTGGDFANSIRLSPGSNTIVIESKDRAGNSVQEILTVTYDTETIGTNWGAIGLMVALLVVGLVLGIFLGATVLKGLFGKEEAPEEKNGADIVTEEGAAEDAVADEPKEAVEEAAEAAQEAAEEATMAEPIPTEESAPEATPEVLQPEALAEEEMPAEPAPAEEDPRIAKLREAYESGKISKELYEKNLAKFKGEQ